MTAPPATGALALGDLPALLDGDGAADLFDGDGVRPTYVRLKDDSAVVGFGLAGYVRTFASSDRAAVVAAKGSGLRPPARLLPGGRSVLYRFPADAALRRADRVLDPDRLKRLLAPLPWAGGAGWRVRGSGSEVEVLRYKPERRLVARARLRLRHDATGAADRRAVVLRRYASADAANRVQRSLVEVQGARPGLVPAALGVADGGLLSVEAVVAGETLGARLAAGADVAAGPVARLLADLHGAPVRFEAASAPADRRRAALGALEMLARAHPPLAAVAERFAGGLRELPAPDGPAVPVHGDLHADQVVLGPDGPVLVDLDRAAMGHPLADLAGLLAHVRTMALEQPAERDRHERFGAELLAEYAALSPLPSPPALDFELGCAWVEQALLRFRTLADGWRERVGALLDAGPGAS